MKGAKIEVVRSRAKRLYSPGGMNAQVQWHVRVRAGNGKILLASETYTRRRAALACAKAVISPEFNCEIDEVDESGDAP